MPKIIKSTNDDLNYLKNNYNHEFLFAEKASELNKLKREIKLCIIRTDFDKASLKLIKKFKSIYKSTEFWIISDELSRENIISANKIGIKTIISSPIKKSVVEEFFNKNNDSKTKTKEKNYKEPFLLNSKVMIVDDNPMNVQLLEEILSSLDLDISTFLKPKDALQAALEEPFDLFLLDIMMPEMSGFELAKKIKNSSINKNVPFIFISALSDSYNKIKGYDMGSLAYIEKPFDINVVKSQIVNVLKNKMAQESIISTQESFLATIAHDLKTPINAEINALKLLLSRHMGELQVDQEEILEDMLGSTKFMREMVENIICKNKIENNNINLSKQVYSLKELIDSCTELTKYILIPKQQKIIVKCDVDNTLIPLDYMEIQRAINNLIANASEYSPEGSKILIEIFKSHKRLGVSVQDFGKGIPLEEQKDVFFEYVTYAKKHKKIGSGLGLFITKNIIEKHNGEIFLESKLGQGTKITFFLPIYNKE